MLSGTESIDELLALWADLLRKRLGLKNAGAFEFWVRYHQSYPAPVSIREHAVESNDPVLLDALHGLFSQDLEDRLVEVENALKKCGVSTQGPNS